MVFFHDATDVYASLSPPLYVLKLYEEFVKWVFAEDEAISAGVKGQFTLQISGCSRADLNGNYVQQRDLYSRRPTFHCAENDRYLFYHGDRQLGCAADRTWSYRQAATSTCLNIFSTWCLRSQSVFWCRCMDDSWPRQQWQIFSRTGRYASARLKTSRAAHMPGEGKMWAVWKASRASALAFSSMLSIFPQRITSEVQTVQDCSRSWSEFNLLESAIQQSHKSKNIYDSMISMITSLIYPYIYNYIYIRTYLMPLGPLPWSEILGASVVSLSQLSSSWFLTLGKHRWLFQLHSCVYHIHS